MAGVVGAGADHERDVVADLVAHRAEQLDRLTLGGRRTPPGRTGEHEPGRAGPEQVRGQPARALAVDRTRLGERRRHGGQHSSQLLHRPSAYRDGGREKIIRATDSALTCPDLASLAVCPVLATRPSRATKETR